MNEMYSLALWAIRRIPCKYSREFAYTEFLEMTKGEGEHAQIARQELDSLREDK